MSTDHHEHGHEAGHSLFDDEQHITTSSEERLVIMANQIAKFFVSQKHGQVEGVRDHIAKYWDPRMRSRIRAHLADGGKGLDPLAKEGVAALTR